MFLYLGWGAWIWWGLSGIGLAVALKNGDRIRQIEEGLGFSGFSLNFLAAVPNGYRMPVIGSTTEYADGSLHQAAVDGMHFLWAADWIHLGWCIASPGDVMIWLAIGLVAFRSLRDQERVAYVFSALFFTVPLLLSLGALMVRGFEALA